jgi:hypothetical protein
MPHDHDTKTWSHSWKIIYSINQVRSRSRWSKTLNALWTRCITPTILSTKLGITQWKNLDYLIGLVIMTHTHDDFECPSSKDYVDTKSWLAYEQNPYSARWVRSNAKWTRTLLALRVWCTPPTNLSTELGANQSKNHNCLEWMGISYLGSTTDPVSDQAYASGHESFGPWCYELSHYSWQFLIFTVTSLTDGLRLWHSSIYPVDGPGTQALNNLLGSIGSPMTPMHIVIHWNTWCMCCMMFIRKLNPS